MSGTNPGDPTASGAAWAQPHPQATLGLSSTTVYGSAFTSSFPLSFQLATGGLLKLIVDPVGFLEAFPGLVPANLTEALASAAFGSSQLTLGTSANIVMGQVYDINIGPPKICVLSKDKTGFQPIALVLGTVMLVLSVVYLIAYAAFGGDQHAEDDQRALLVILFQGAIQTCIAALIAVSNTHVNISERKMQNTIDVLFTVQGAPLRLADPATWGQVLEAVAIALPFAVILPPVLDGLREAKLGQLDEKPPSK